MQKNLFGESCQINWKTILGESDFQRILSTENEKQGLHQRKENLGPVGIKTHNFWDVCDQRLSPWPQSIDTLIYKSWKCWTYHDNLADIVRIKRDLGLADRLEAEASMHQILGTKIK